MNSDLKQMTEKWMQLERKTLEQRAKADAFYENNLLELIAQDYILRNKPKVLEKVEYLIMSVGTSIEPIILNIRLFQPKKILFLCTEQSEPLLDKIIERCKLSASNYQKVLIGETDPISIYREIKASYLAWSKPEKIYIDFTGGTKAMSAAAAMAGALIDVSLVYVGSTKYLKDFRKPEPGSEILVYIDNPITVFGDLEIEKAMVLFDENNYTGAKEKLGELMRDVPEPNTRQQLEFAYLLASAYEAWDSLDFVKAEEQMKALNAALKRDFHTHSRFLLMDLRGHLIGQGDILADLKTIPEKIREKNHMDVLKNKQLMAELIFTMYQNAMIRERQAKYDMASLLLYRLLEMIEQSRLADYNLFVSRMDYTQMNFEPVKDESVKTLEDLQKNMNAVRKGVFGRISYRELPDPVSLLEGYMLLLALGDEISQPNATRRYDFIKRLRSMVYLRNNSIFAHGLGPVGQEDYTKFRIFVLEVLSRYCQLEGINIAEYQSRIRWITPRDSAYFTNLGRN